MSLDKTIKNYTEENGYLPLFNYNNIQTIGDGNCWLRTLSLFFEGNQDNYKQYRKEVSEFCKDNKEELRKFFVQDVFNKNDKVLENYTFDDYIENISKDYFYSGIIELLVSSQIYRINISIYVIENNIYYYYKRIACIGENYNDEIKLSFTNNIHYSLLVSYKNPKININKNLKISNYKEKKKNELDTTKLSHKLDNLNIDLNKLVI